MSHVPENPDSPTSFKKTQKFRQALSVEQGQTRLFKSNPVRPAHKLYNASTPRRLGFVPKPSFSKAITSSGCQLPAKAEIQATCHTATFPKDSAGGAAEVSPRRKPWETKTQRWEPRRGGTLLTSTNAGKLRSPSFSAQCRPSGARAFFSLHPGLAPWANICRAVRRFATIVSQHLRSAAGGISSDMTKVIARLGYL